MSASRILKIGLASLGGLILAFAALGMILVRRGKEGPLALFVLMPKATLIVGLCGIGYLCARALVRLRQRAGTQEARNATGAVVDTFRTLILQLKDKEQALERLKQDAEDRGKSIESYNENILQSVTSGVITLDLQKRITTFNAAASSILNLPSAAVMGKPYAAVVGDDLTAILDQIGAREQRRMEYQVRRPDAAVIWIGMNSSVLRNGAGEGIGATIVLSDLTEIKHLQEQIELKRRLALMGEMSAWVAHEFRNYMGTILGFGSLLAKKTPPDDPRHGMAQAINREILAMERLITQLLDYAKTSVIHADPVALETLLRQLADQFSTPSVRFHLSLEETEALLDPVLIRQAFSNLLQNSVEAMEGVGEIRMILTRHPEGVVQIRISDTGPGIPGAQIPQLFLPFFTTKEKGTGLGLALVHKIVMAHNGQISVSSPEGEGAIFTVALPILPPHPAAF
jgi:PAS domain S-box-containing protein